MTESFGAAESCVIIGGGLAGLSAALALAPSPVILLSKAAPGLESSSWLAQGGIAAAIGADDDFSLHLADTLTAGDGLCDETAARAILAEGSSAIEDLIRLGVPFDRDGEGRILLGLEAAHSRRRIVHASGDSSGREIMRALARRVGETPSITFVEGTASRLIVEDNRVSGVLVSTRSGPAVIAASRVVIATGGIGGLYKYGTNPAGSFGQGLALAARAGAVMGDLEFVQFHPTALDTASFPLKLISETVRGEGAILVDEAGERFMACQPGAELAPRDVVSRAVWRHMAAGHRVFLDARNVPGLDFARRFPAITGFCHAAGIDPATQLIPIRPAAHYHMGGISVDLRGRSSVEGLWACGEAACTGLHGANRLASNSLLEAAVCGRLVATDIAATPVSRAKGPRNLETAFAPLADQLLDQAPVREILSHAAGVQRDGEGLREAIRALYPLASEPSSSNGAAVAGLMIAVSALRRRESRGAHSRTDFPDKAPSPQRTMLRLDDALADARELVPEMAD
ncbi:L-aspartate oxidase [Methylocapsa palsarum]|uniref:L-aspartate oxidase n=1 Tax=Methylocapsa palsarum TaxID=1612308 RepID=A0A1I3W0X9_9HYPH|nr:L-aspartate oxidase [Methylocapsa palsarum]SFK01082.1 L-aspartate oxidase [Methylocapsa palsarum]